MRNLDINSRCIGPGQSVYIIAEMSANHGQNLNQAMELVHAAKSAGADAIKLQTYTPDTITIDADQEYFRVGPGTVWEGRMLHELYAEAFTPWEWQPPLKDLAEQVGLDCFSTPFDASAVDFLEQISVPAYKIASFEIVDLELLRQVAATGKPVILSTGMASLDEIAVAVDTVREAGNDQLALLRCSSAYPAPVDELHLRTIPHLSEAFDVPVGLSDHTLEIAVPVAAVTLGACIVEKHLTLSRSIAGPDATFSLEPDEFCSMVQAVRSTESALGQVHYGVGQREAKSRQFRRSLFVVEDVSAGERFTAKNVRSIRPADGLPPRYLPEVLGRVAVANIRRGTPLNWRHVA